MQLQCHRKVCKMGRVYCSSCAFHSCLDIDCFRSKGQREQAGGHGYIDNNVHSSPRSSIHRNLQSGPLKESKEQCYSGLCDLCLLLQASLAKLLLQLPAFEKEAKLRRLARWREKRVPQASSGDANSTTMP